MGDAEDKLQGDAPAWQKAAQPEPDAATEPSTATVEQARRFLEDPEVQKQTPERKIEFLRSKGLSESDVEELLKDVSQDPQTEPPVVGQDRAAVSQPEPPSSSSPPPSSSETISTQTVEKKEDRPLIITYPEFLTKPVRPPPLMTMNGFLNTLYAFGGFSTLLYGTSKFVVEPMVQSQTEARISLHETAKDSLTKLVEKLKGVVSEIPPSVKTAPSHTDNSHDEDDAKSSYEDPHELYHRDIGVQTSLPSSPAGSDYEESPPEPASHRQARRLTELVASVKAVSDGLIGQTEDLGDVKSLLDVFRDELDQLSTAGLEYGTGFSMYGSANRNEPDDEIKKAKENIRRVKGVLLSTRSFPASTTRYAEPV
ncbi:peroxisomal membrane protein PEX14 [Podospora aff. communis PSN243]|uniref:Peroxisomal membrane protein PEX14 n=1 Tax=Podospora aff. communis PSN243 TaxID=3040156 RepID=A0AAV9H534_9PEZI|nr:peroxisomal membrane protein PEX14 [Podospora aff. communis PSN243]